MSRSTSSIAANLALAIQPSSNGRHLCLHNDISVPFFWLADTAWELFHRLDKAEATTYLKNRAAKGFNVVLAVLMAEHGQLDYPNRFGEYPFEGGANPDTAKPNLRYYEFVDWVVDYAATLGIRIALVPTWGRYINGGYYQNSPLFTEETCYSYGKFLGRRYPFLPFVIGGDSNRYWNSKQRELSAAGVEIASVPLLDWGAYFESMAKGVAEGEAMHKHLAPDYITFMLFHPAQMWLPSGPVATGGRQFPNAEWLSLDTCQSGHYNCPRRPISGKDLGGAGQTGLTNPDPKTWPGLWESVSSYQPIRIMYNTPRPNGKPRPVVDLEAHYENTYHWFREGYPLWQADNVRRGAWQGVLSGACGYTYGVNSIWQFHNDTSKTHPPITGNTRAFANWFIELDLSGAFQVGTVRRILEGLPGYFNRIPDQSFIASDTHEPKEGLAGEALICGTRESTGQWAMVQLPFGRYVILDLDLALPGKEGWNAWWLDPRIGSKEVFQTGEGLGIKTFKAPDENDWLLLVTAL